MSKFIASLFAASVVFTAVAPTAFAEKAAVTKPAAAGETVTAKVNGMVCDFCAQSVKKVFKKEAAVSDVRVDLDAGAVVISLKPGKTMADERIKTLIKKSGYALTGIERAAG